MISFLKAAVQSLAICIRFLAKSIENAPHHVVHIKKDKHMVFLLSHVKNKVNFEKIEAEILKAAGAFQANEVSSISCIG